MDVVVYIDSILYQTLGFGLGWLVVMSGLLVRIAIAFQSRPPVEPRRAPITPPNTHYDAHSSKHEQKATHAINSRDTPISQLTINAAKSLPRYPFDFIDLPTTTQFYSNFHEIVGNYHAQALAQARLQGTFGIIAASIGFVYILAVPFTHLSNDLAAVIKIVPGAIVSAVSSLFFVQAQQTRNRATELYDRIRSDQNILTSVSQINKIADPQLRDQKLGELALFLAGVRRT